MEIVTDTTAALRSELETARELAEAYRALTREARRDLEAERRENARLRERLAELESAGNEGLHWCTACGTYKPESRYDNVVHRCADCVEGEVAPS